jgi:hypothetical protein
MDNASSTEHTSAPYKAFEINVNRLVALAQNNLDPLRDSLKQATETLALVHSSTADIIQRIGFLRAAPASVDQPKVNSVTADLEEMSRAFKPLGASIDTLGSLVKSTSFLYTWMIVMLVAFAEAYIEDALKLLISSGLSATSLPAPIIGEMKRQWIKDILRRGKPHQWITALEKVGVTGYDKELADKLSVLWTRRHNLVHSPLAEVGSALTNELCDAITLVSNFVKTTDRFIAQSHPNA